MFEYTARIVRVLDADTVDADVDLGLHVHTATRLRLLGLDAPERGTHEGRAATLWLRELLPAGRRVRIRTEKDRTEKYGRWLATIEVDDGPTVNELLIATGHATAWDGTGTRPSD